MRTMQPLRIVAIASNVAFLIYGLAFQLWPIAILHALLLPLNIIRLVQIRRVLAHIESVSVRDVDVLKLLPYLDHADYPAGTVLFRRGDPTDGAYYIASGEVEIPEARVRLQPGQFFGEVGVFSSSRVRTASAVCASPARLHKIANHDLAVAFYRDPVLAFALVRLITDRMEDNSRRAAQAMAAPQVSMEPVADTNDVTSPRAQIR
jgi:CRP/FNR family cyclic AMP-dependent transcriptional regulator